MNPGPIREPEEWPLDNGAEPDLQIRLARILRSLGKMGASPDPTSRDREALMLNLAEAAHLWSLLKSAR